ncbi:hypothetical protein E2C01_004491 [Portunus trituberculatus]|uniref:Uncharacterized protein n=1 Tax=Portunus trituberculatus TaxID=210409 RepID=A0A5B7CU50_PORTR|nr:hypothetical protein [Portunus trituberculatus]
MISQVLKGVSPVRNEELSITSHQNCKNTLKNRCHFHWSRLKVVVVWNGSVSEHGRYCCLMGVAITTTIIIINQSSL